MKRKIAAGLTVLAMLGTALPIGAADAAGMIAWAEDAQEKPTSGKLTDTITWSFSEDGVLTVSGTGDMPDYNDNGYYPPWHRYEYNLPVKSVVIEDGITSVGAYAFHNLDLLTSVTISDSVTILKQSAFSDSDALTSITIPESVTYIEWAALSYCKGLTEINLGSSIVHVGEYAFDGTPWLKDNMKEGEVFIQNSVVISGKGCTGEVVIPDGVTCIADRAFGGCDKVTAVTLPDSLKGIGDSAFAGTGLTEVTLPDGVEMIGGNAFYNTGLTEVQLPESVKVMTGNPFSHTPWFSAQLEENPLVILDGFLLCGEDGIEGFGKCEGAVTIPDSVTYITPSSFSYARELTSVTVPESVTFIGEAAFVSCGALAEFTVLNPDCVLEKGCVSTLYEGSYGVNYYEYSGTIKGYDGSTAEAFAKKYDYKFESLGAAPEQPAETFCDISGDNIVNASDAALVLIAAAAVGAGDASKAIDIEKADINGDKTVNASDAALILIYSAAVGAGYDGTLQEYFANRA